MSATYNFRTPKLAKIYTRLTVGNYYVSRYDTRIVRYTGSLQTPPSLAPVLDTVTAAANTLVLSFNTQIILTGQALEPSAWTITPPNSDMVVGVTVTGVSLSGSTVTLTTSEQTGGAIYTLNVPQGFIFSTPGGLAFLGPFQKPFTGAATPTPIISCISVDAQTLLVYFARAVQPAGALNPSNYSLSPSVTVLSVTQLSPNGFRLTTAPQSTGQTYTLTASNIYDLAFNPI